MSRPGAESEPRDPGPHTLVAALGPPARDVLWALIDQAQATDPLAPVTVAVPSPYAGLALRRELGHRRGLVNVRFVALARIAEQLGAPRLAAAGRAPLTAARRVEAVHAVLQAEPGPFVAVAEHRGTEVSLAATFADLRRASPGTLKTLAARGAGTAAIVALYERFLDATRDGYDEEDLARVAADAVDDGASLDELGTVIVHLPRRRSAAEQRLVAALAAQGRATVVEAPAVDDGLPGPPPRLLAAPDPDDEARAALRRLLAAAESGTSLGRMALLYPVAEPYARLVPELLTGAAVPWNGPSPQRLADSVTGRVVAGLVDLVDAGFPRDAVAAWLATGPILDEDGRRVPGARWDLISRAAGVVAGTDQWDDRLARYADGLDQELAAARVDDDQPEWRVGLLERDAEQTRRLQTFITELVIRTQPPASPRWADLSTWAHGLLTRYLGGEGRRRDWPTRDLESARRIEQTLAELATLDTIGSPVDLTRFRVALASALDTPASHVGRFGTGIFVGPLHAAFGTDFEVVTILGGAEGALPPHGREDPFLTDADRAAAGLATTAERRAEDRRDYLAALAGAASVTVCFPRADPRAQQARLPARWLLEAAAVHVGHPVTAEQLRSLPAQPWLDVVASFEAGVVRDAEPGSLVERDLRALAEWRHVGRPVVDHPLAAGPLGRGYLLASSRASDTFTGYDGNCGSPPAPGDGDRPAISATALQDWATCPFRYLLGRVLRVHDVPRPEATDTIHPLDEGLLVHAILEAFVRERPPHSPDDPWTGADRDRLLEIVDKHCRDAQSRGITGRPLLWRLAQRRITRGVLRFLEIDTALRRTHRAAPRAEDLEVAFGLAGQPGVVVPLARDRSVTFRGRIDRLDRSRDGQRVVVYDYKTGDPQWFPSLSEDPVVAGQLLQLPVYALAAAARTGAADAEAYYWFTRAETPEEAVEGFPLDREVQARFVHIVDTIVEGVDQGCFPAVPGERSFDYRVQRETFAHCFNCPYDRLCAPDRATAWAKKAADPAVAVFVGLAAEDTNPP